MIGRVDRSGARRSPTGALPLGPYIAVLRSPRGDHVLQLFPAHGPNAAREAHLESAARQAEISASPVHPLPAQRPLRQHPSAGLAPVEAPEVLFDFAVLVDPQRIRHRVVARPSVIFVLVLHWCLHGAATPAPRADPDIPECQLHLFQLLWSCFRLPEHDSRQRTCEMHEKRIKY